MNSRANFNLFWRRVYKPHNYQNYYYDANDFKNSHDNSSPVFFTNTEDKFYIIDYKGRSVVISGDTAKSKNLEKYATGADILVHEALNEKMIDIMIQAFKANKNTRLATIFQDIKAIHTTPIQASESAEIANVKMLVLSHIVPPAPSKMLNAFYLDGTAQKFDGKIVLGQDGMMFSLAANGSEIQRRNLK